MSKSDAALVVLNLATLVWAVIGLTAQHLDPMSVAATLAIATAVLNGGALLLRSRQSSGRSTVRPIDAVDEMDAAQILDLDARLEALERRDEIELRALLGRGPLAEPLAESNRQRVAQRERA